MVTVQKSLRNINKKATQQQFENENITHTHTQS